MSKYRVTTESGAVYTIDNSELTAVREAPADGSAPLDNDGLELRIFVSIGRVAVGCPLRFVHGADETAKFRSTTPVVSIEEIK